MIVGHKIEQTVTVEPRDYGNHHEVTTLRVVTELHSTKGWRKLGRNKRTVRVLDPPTHLQRSKDTYTRFIRHRAVTEPAG